MKDIINFLQNRRSVTAIIMIAGEVSENDLEKILSCGIRVPDHGALNPWELIVIKDEARLRFGNQVLAKEFELNNPIASADEIEFERNRFCRASIVIAVLFKPVSHPKIPNWEMELSCGAVCSNILIASQSLGYAAQWLTEWYAYNSSMIRKLGGNPKTDKVAGFIYIGNKDKAPNERRRPNKDKVISYIVN